MYSKEQVKEATLKYFNGDGLASDVWISKYCLKDKEGNLLELNPDDMHHRLAKEFSRIESKYPSPMSEEEIYGLFKDFKYIVPGGSPMSGIGNNHQIQSISNCYVIGNQEDSYGSILKVDEEQVHIMRRRGGVGSDLSHIRPNGTTTTCAANTSTGIVPFAERYSNSTRETAQNGRRGARMLSLDIKHPDCEEFIDSKLEQGKITGSNISVRITDEFMDCVLNNKDFIQTFPIDLNIDVHTGFCESLFNNDIEYDRLYDFQYKGDNEFKGRYVKKKDSIKLWDKIIKNAHRSAEPGILFIDHIRRESPSDCYGIDWKTESSNPCFAGDQALLTSKGYKTFESLSKWCKVNPKKYLLLQNISGDNCCPGIVFESGLKKTIVLNFTEGISIRCTPDHVFINGNGEEIKAKDSLGEILSSYEFVLSKVESIQDGKLEKVYDFSILDPVNGHWGVVNNIISHNCGEIPMNFYSSCILICLNLYSYVENPFTVQAKFNWKLFKEHSYVSQKLADDIVDMEIEKIDQILDKVKNDPESDSTKFREIELWNKIKEKIILGRRTGLGVTAEGDMVAALGLRYGTKEATDFCIGVHKELAIQSYRSSIHMAEERGSFPIFDYLKEGNNPFIQRIFSNLTFEDQQIYVSHGRRNIANLTIAPTGSVSILTQTTSGIEPVFLPVYKRRRKVNPEDKDSKPTFKDENGDWWEEYNVFHHKFIDWFKIEFPEIPIGYLKSMTDEEIQIHVEYSPYYKATSNDIDWEEKVKMQGQVQKWVDHSISVTVNIPEETTEEVVSMIYKTAYSSGCKGITVYREGSRSGVLVSNKKENKGFGYTNAFKRPGEIDCNIHRLTVMKQPWLAVVGLIDNKPYEIFVLKGVPNEIFPFYLEKGIIKKIKRRTYLLISEHKDKVYNLNLNDHMSEDEQSSTRDFSMMLRHGIHPKHIIEQVTKQDGSMISLKKAVSRILKLYIKDGDKVSGEKCPECGSGLIFMEGCMKCVNCTFSKCG